MLIALYNGRRVRAHIAGSGALGTCPWTRLPVKACVGEILQYWAYVGGAPKLPAGYEPESEWHEQWKATIEDAHCEVVMGPNDEHRADIRGSDDTVIEIQHSRIDIRDSRARVDFYRTHTDRRVIWVVDIQDIWRKTFMLDGRRDDKGNFLVKWSHVREWLWDLAGTKDTNCFLEFNQTSDKLLHVWVHQKMLYAKYVSKRTFFLRYMDAVAKPEYKGYSSEAEAFLRRALVKA
jgi:hypothetical protein